MKLLQGVKDEVLSYFNNNKLLIIKLHMQLTIQLRPLFNKHVEFSTTDINDITDIHCIKLSQALKEILLNRSFSSENNKIVTEIIRPNM